MGFFDFLRLPNINSGVAEFNATPGAVLLDVRSPAEYSGGKIPGSINLPIQDIDKIGSVTENKDTPFFVYCYSGARSGQAVSRLHELGYKNAKNIGGFAAYSGKVE